MIACWMVLRVLAMGGGDATTEVPALPPLAALEQLALRKLGLDAWDYGDARARLRMRHWLPTITLRFNASEWDRTTVDDALDVRRSGMTGEVSATWHLAGLAYDEHEIALSREHVRAQEAIGRALRRVRQQYAVYRRLSAGGASGLDTQRRLAALKAALLAGRNEEVDDDASAVLDDPGSLRD